MQLQDLDKLQKEVEIYHKENERLQNELQLMKQELLSTEKAALSASGSSKSHISELLQRIKELEEQQLQLSSEADELREQNELLEFRILELEDDKVNWLTHRLTTKFTQSQFVKHSKSHSNKTRAPLASLWMNRVLRVE